MVVCIEEDPSERSLRTGYSTEGLSCFIPATGASSYPITEKEHYHSETTGGTECF